MDFSFESINALTQSANGMTGALKGAVDLVGGVKALLKSPQRASDAEIEAALDKLALTMENARLNNAMLEMQVMKLSEDIRRAQEAEAKLNAYTLYRTLKGQFVYSLKATDGTPEGNHFICPQCYERGARSILQGDDFYKTCHSCRTGYDFISRPMPQISNDWV